MRFCDSIFSPPFLAADSKSIIGKATQPLSQLNISNEDDIRHFPKMLQTISRSNLTKSRLSNQSTLSLTYLHLAQPTKNKINTNLRHFPTTLGVTQIKQKLGTHDQPRISTAINPFPNIYLFLSFSLPLKSNHFVSKDQK
jgi:hypothetical protein